MISGVLGVALLLIGFAESVFGLAGGFSAGQKANGVEATVTKRMFRVLAACGLIIMVGGAHLLLLALNGR